MAGLLICLLSSYLVSHFYNFTVHLFQMLTNANRKEFVQTVSVRTSLVVITADVVRVIKLPKTTNDV